MAESKAESSDEDSFDPAKKEYLWDKDKVANRIEKWRARTSSPRLPPALPQDLLWYIMQKTTLSEVSREYYQLYDRDTTPQLLEITDTRFSRWLKTRPATEIIEVLAAQVNEIDQANGTTALKQNKELHAKMCDELEKRLAILLAKSIYQMEQRGGVWPETRQEGSRSAQWKTDKHSNYTYTLHFDCVTSAPWIPNNNMSIMYIKRNEGLPHHTYATHAHTVVKVNSGWPQHTPDEFVPKYTDSFKLKWRIPATQQDKLVESNTEWPVHRQGIDFDREGRLSLEQSDMQDIETATQKLDPSGRAVAWNQSDLEALDKGVSNQSNIENDTFPRSICCIAGVLAVALPSLRRYAPDKYKPFVVHMRSIGITALDT